MKPIHFWLPALWILACGLACADLMLGAEYVHDDHAAIVGNPLVRWPVDVGAILRGRYFGPVEVADVFPSRPLVTVLSALEVGLGWTSAGARHAVQLALHVGLLATLWRLVRDLLPDAAPARATLAATATTALFALHPLHAEVLMGLANRPELVGLGLCLAASWLLLQVRLGKSGWRAAALASALWFLALMAKESAVAALPVWVLWALHRPVTRQRLLPALGWPLPALGIWAGWHHWNAGGDLTPVVSALDNPLAHVATHERLWTALGDTARAWQRLVWPASLSPDYTLAVWPAQAQPGAASWAGLGMLGAACAGLAVAAWPQRQGAAAAPQGPRHPVSGADQTVLLPDNRERLVLAGAVLLGFWLPVSNLLIASTTRFGDRLLFAPSLAAAAGAAWLLLRLPRTRLAWLALGALAVPLAGWQRSEAAPWQREETLFAHGVARAPDSMRMRHNRAHWLLQRDRAQEALEHTRALLQISAKSGYLDSEQAIVALDVLVANQQCEEAGAVVRWAHSHKRSVRLRITLGRWGMACGKAEQAWALVRGMRPVDGPDATDVYVLAIAAGDAEGAAAWARTCGVDRPDIHPVWASAAVFADQHAGRFASAIGRLAVLQRAQPALPGLAEAARALAAQAPAGAEAEAARAALERAFARQPAPGGDTGNRR